MENILIQSALSSPKALKSTLSKKVNKDDFKDQCLEFIAWTIFISNTPSNKAILYIEVLISQLEKSNHHDLKISAYYSKFNSLIIAKEYKKLTKEFTEILDFSIDKKCVEEGKEICSLIYSSLNEWEGLPIETNILFLREIVYFSYKVKDFENAISLSLIIADIFTSRSAYQSAYRILQEAMDSAIEINDVKMIAEVYAQIGLTAYFEEDYDYASKALNQSIEFYNEISLETPIKILNNFATALMRNQEFKRAIVIYNNLLKKDLENDLKQIVYLNLVVCYRDNNELLKAEETYKKIDATFFERTNIDRKIEFQLISANTFCLMRKFDSAIKFTTAAIEDIESELESIYRLHYRRGYRERYFKRIQGLLLKFIEPELIGTLEFERLLQIILFLKMNMFSDWFSLNEWVENIYSLETISATEKEDLKNTYEELKKEGLPIFNSYHEKYDDPFEDYNSRAFGKYSGTSIKWNEFNIIINNIINKYNVTSPYKNANSLNIFVIILEKIRNENTFLISKYISKNGISLVYNNKDTFCSFNLPIEKYITFREKIDAYQTKFCSLSEFRSILRETVSSYKLYFEDLINMINRNSNFNLIILDSSILKNFPIMAIILENDSIRKKILSNDLKIYYSPIIRKSKFEHIRINKYLGFFEPFQELPLLEPELKLSQQLELFEECDISNFANDIDTNKMRGMDFIHVASHGFPISNYTDPIFARMSGNLSKNSFSLAQIQLEFNEFDYKIVFLSMCDSSDQLNKTFMKKFETNEAISYPSLFMLNQKSIVISINWPMLDLIPYVFTHILLTELKTETIFVAFNKTLVKLYDINISELLDILNNIDDEALKNKKKEMFKYQNPLNHPFRDPYIFGAFTLTSLIL